MLVENQKLTVKWHPASRSWYENKGYEFTKYNQPFEIDVKDLSPGSSARVEMICDICGAKYDAYYYSISKYITNGDITCCSHCAGKKAQSINEKSRAEERYDKAFEKCSEHGLKLISNISDFYNVRDCFVDYVCPIHGEQRMRYYSFLKSKTGCYKCSCDHIYENYAYRIEDIKNEIESFNGVVWLNPQEYKNALEKNLIIRCNKCHDEYTTSLQLFRSSRYHTCPKCGFKELAKQHRLHPDDIEAEINSFNGNTLMNKEEYRRNSICNLEIKCGICGSVWTTSLEQYRHSFKQCPQCRNTRSLGEYNIREFLKQNNIEFETEKRFDKCKAKRELPFDFYLPNQNAVIEFNGKQHYEPIEYYGGKEGFEYRLVNDKIKKDFCESEGITFIEIPYTMKPSEVEERLQTLLFS